MILWNRSPGLGIAEDWFSTAQYFDIKYAHRGFEQVAIAIGANYNLTGGGGPSGSARSASRRTCCRCWGRGPAAGRLFGPQDDSPGTTGTAVLGHATWMRRYGGDPGVIGRAVVLNGQPYEMVGVLAAGFDLPREVDADLGGAEHAEVVLPLAARRRSRPHAQPEDYNIVGKLKPGVGRSSRRRRSSTPSRPIAAASIPAFYPPNGGLTFDVVPLHEQVVGDVRQRAAGPDRGGGLRAAHRLRQRRQPAARPRRARQGRWPCARPSGAGRGALVRELLAESLLLALAGGALGLLFCTAASAALVARGRRACPGCTRSASDSDVLLFTLGVSLVSGLALRPGARPGSCRRPDLQASLTEGRHGAPRARAPCGRVATACAGCWWQPSSRSVRRPARGRRPAGAQLRAGPAGAARLQPENVLTFELTMTGRQYAEPSAVLEAYRLLWQRMASLPGVSGAGGVSALPLSQMMAWGPITVEGRTPRRARRS